MNSVDASKQFTETVRRFARIGGDLLQAWSTTAAQLAEAGASFKPLELAPKTTDRCNIPRACWLPRDLGQIESLTCPGGRAVLRIHITNCDMRSHRFDAAISESELKIEVTPDALPLKPMEAGWITVTADLPADANDCRQYELLLWMAGCNYYFLRWTIEASTESQASCHEIEVDDCPDYVHHWYDHFYCRRPCFATRRVRDTKSA